MKAFEVTYNAPTYPGSNYTRTYKRIVPAVDIISAANKIVRKLKVARRDILTIETTTQVVLNA